MSIFDAMKKIFLACLMLAGASLLSGCFNDKGDDEPVYIPAKLKPRDLIEFGDCKFIFVPFCDESFSWKEEKGE